MSKSKKTSLTTRTGKVLLGPLNLQQLNDLLSKSSRPKDKAKIQRRISTIIKRNDSSSNTTIETAKEQTIAE